MERVIPWARLCVLIEPYYPKGSSEGGRPSLPLGRMFRIYCLQQWYNLSDPGAEEALYDSITMRQFAGVRTDALGGVQLGFVLILIGQYFEMKLINRLLPRHH